MSIYNKLTYNNDNVLLIYKNEIYYHCFPHVCAINNSSPYRLMVVKSEALECLKKRYPKLLGSTQGLTRIDFLNIDQDLKNVVLTGKSSDPSFIIVDSSKTPCFVALFPDTGFDYLWAK